MHRPPRARPESSFDVAVVGGGASGTLAAIHLLARCAALPVRVAVFEPSGRPGRGVAYATPEPSHLLNVPAGGMSAFRDAPEHFLDWLRRRGGEWQAGSFAPRGLFGDYLAHALREAQRAAPSARLDLCASEVVRIDRDRDGWVLTQRGGARAFASATILALGHGAPEDLPVPDDGLYRSARYHRGPWRLRGARVRDPVLLLGTGLTMVDAVLTLLASGFRGKIVATSRRGVLPQPHAFEVEPFDGWSRAPPSGGLRAMLRRFRAECARASGRDWRAVVDALRPHTAALWQQLGVRERRQFLEHLQPYWGSVRHRVAPQAARSLDACLASGQLSVAAGRVIEFRRRRDSVDVVFRRRGEAAFTTLRAGTVITCTTPGARVGRGAPAVMGALIESGAARADVLGLGLVVDDDGRVIGGDARASESLFAIGPLRRGMCWESVAIPEIRAQAQQLAERIAAGVALG